MFFCSFCPLSKITLYINFKWIFGLKVISSDKQFALEKRQRQFTSLPKNLNQIRHNSGSSVFHASHVCFARHEKDPGPHLAFE